MSFGGQSTSSGFALKSFVTEDEVEEKKRIRQEQWEKVRKADDPLECPEEDTRSLFDKLQEQKDKKQQEYEEQFKFSNAVKGLEDDEAEFLDEVSRRQMQIEKERLNEETSIFREMRDANVAKVAEKASTKDGEKSTGAAAAAKSAPMSSSRKSQQSLLLGAVKRKSADTPDDSKKQRVEDADSSTVDSSTEEQPLPRRVNGVARVIGILPGIGNYSDDSTDSNSSNSDSDLDEFMTRPKVKRIVIQSKEGC
ncbi:PSME3-interacting protein-like [Haliotis rubra]|uniref:PSME3-interacting protein-like n=1 Tax=Haliotis rubra TaxID=36100 RepID=UPI001EE5C0A8|nr:PSME3-interacting protein-like [Haliotis rubra]